MSWKWWWSLTRADFRGITPDLSERSFLRWSIHLTRSKFEPQQLLPIFVVNWGDMLTLKFESLQMKLSRSMVTGVHKSKRWCSTIFYSFWASFFQNYAVSICSILALHFSLFLHPVVRNEPIGLPLYIGYISLYFYTLAFTFLCKGRKKFYTLCFLSECGCLFLECFFLRKCYISFLFIFTLATIWVQISLGHILG